MDYSIFKLIHENISRVIILIQIHFLTGDYLGLF